MKYFVLYFFDGLHLHDHDIHIVCVTVN